MIVEVTPALIGVGVVLIGALIGAIVLLRLTSRDVERIVPRVEDYERRLLEKRARIEALERLVGNQGTAGSLVWAKWEHENAIRKAAFKILELEKRSNKHSDRITATTETIVEALENTGRHAAIEIPAAPPRPRLRSGAGRPLPREEPSSDDEGGDSEP